MKETVVPQRMPLLLAAVCGMLYIAVVPPWQHYDEPTHFEHAWLIANRQTLPQYGDHDQAMRREVAASMLEHDFFRDMDLRPNLLDRDSSIWIGISECGHPHLYYLLVALPLRLIRHADVTFQLYVARVVSLLLYLLSVWIAYRLVGELTPEGHPLRWAVPGMMALLPAYTDVMTAVNNDVGATVIFSLFLWGVVRMLRRGLTFCGLLWMTMTAALCVWTKSTAAAAVLLAPLGLMLTLVRGPRARWVWGAMMLAAVLSVFALFYWGDAAFWYRDTAQSSFTRQRADASPHGQYVLALETVADAPSRQVSQLLAREDIEALRGKTVTLGAWIWAKRPVDTRSAMLCSGQQSAWQAVEATSTPTFHAVTATVPASAGRIEVVLRPLLDTDQQRPVTVFYDGVVLADGERPLDRPPAFDDADGPEGTWGTRPFVNRVRNGSAEAAWPWVRPWVETAIVKPLRKYQHRPPLRFLASVLDWRRTGWVYRASGVNLFQSFWARFGWNHIELPKGWYRVLGPVTALGLAGALLSLARLWRSGQSSAIKRAVAFLALAGIVVWANAFLRPHPLVGKPFIPSARYAYPAIIPTALALTRGWLSWVPRRMREKAGLGLLVGLVLLDVVSLITIWTFYYRGGGD